MRSPLGGQVGPDGPCLLGLARVRWGRICSKRNLEWNPGKARHAGSWRVMQPSFGWHTTVAAVLRVRAPDVCCASRTSTRPSAIVAALAATVVGTSSRWQPTTMATATAQTPRSRRTAGASPSSGSRGCTGSRQASRRPRGSLTPTERPIVGVRLRSRMRTCPRPSPACSP
jgi:hypothetical protein